MSLVRSVRLRAAAATLLALTLLPGCSLVEDLRGGEEAVEATAPKPPKAAPISNSQFTRDGTFQSHIDIEGLDFVYTLYPTKSTPRTNEWYPRGNKFFSFTFQAYDLDRKLRDPFSTKRRVYLERISVTSKTTTTDGGRTQHPYRLDAVARDITFDPEPLTTPLGMLVTSPKGAFELRNQRIRPTSLDTRGIDLTFAATVWIQRRAGVVGPGAFVRRQVEQTVPIAVFASKEKTEVAKIPVNAN